MRKKNNTNSGEKPLERHVIGTLEGGRCPDFEYPEGLAKIGLAKLGGDRGELAKNYP